MTTRADNPNQGGIEKVRRYNDGSVRVLPTGYLDEAEQVRPIPGDASFPYFKDPPDLQPSVVLRDEAVLPVAGALAGYETSAEIETLGYRLLELTLGFTPADPDNGTSILSVVAEKLDRNPATNQPLWKVQGVIEPTLYTPAIEQGFAYRNIFASELRFEPYIDRVAPFPLPQQTLFEVTFDVATTQAMRFRWACIGTNPASGLMLAYYRLQR